MIQPMQNRHDSLLIVLDLLILINKSDNGSMNFPPCNSIVSFIPFKVFLVVEIYIRKFFLISK